MYENLTGREPHPVLAIPDPDRIAVLSPEDQEKFWKQRKELLIAEQIDPLRFGYEPKSWKRADKALREMREKHPIGVIIFLVLGGHRAGKTEWRSKRTVQAVFSNTNYKVWACQATQEASRESQQIPIYKYLPYEYKNESGKLRKGKTLKVNYTPWAGFTEDVFAVQNIHGTTSECRFKFYSMDPRSLEGAEINEAWADEEAKLEWLEALIYRLTSRNGILYMTFTPRWGYTQTVKTILNGAVTVEEGETDTDLIAVRDAKGNVLAAKKVPVVQENNAIEIPGHKVKGAIVYFHTCENPFPLGNWANMKETLKGSNEEKIMTVAYGVPTRSMMASFPMFRDLVHVVSLNRFREIQKGGGVFYHFLDPASQKNWFQIWVFVDVANRAFIVAESPSHGHKWAYIPGIGDPGPWAVAGNKADGEPGDGQKEWGFGYTRYLEEIDRIERLLSSDVDAQRMDAISTPQTISSDGTNPSAQKVKVTARWIDARYGNSPRTGEERATTLVEDLSNLGMDFLAAPSETRIDGGRGGGDGSLRMINDRLYYDMTREIDHTNQPRLFVVETCPNVIFSLKEWSGRDGTRGASKDPVDVVRMFVLSGAGYIDESLLQPVTPWMGQFNRK